MSSEFNRSIVKVIELADKLELLFQAGAAASLNVSYEVKKTTRKATSYTEVYDVIAGQQEFNIMLSDRSMFQFTETKQNEELRLVYYPNPYQFVEYQSIRKEALELLDSKEFTEVEYEQYISEADFSCDVPVIRYDLSVDQHCEYYHPAAHFHIGFYAENRWPVDRVLTPLAFFLKILANYYPSTWKSQEDLTLVPKVNTLDLQYRNELKNNCGVISINSPQHFKPIESERMCFR
ncbi:DUF2290 domain-containing protein [Vibrio lentus]|uniref:DUF2290 domain-containing protein n=1 Tax=Vibrio lentus TaxID=136468 RepID=UPI000C820E2F|nr:DUF2290 domain-containing protein [Vibrio lentus]PMI85188.1 hypothetical protein BCU36_04255 [Vibrio lentus]